MMEAAPTLSPWHISETPLPDSPSRSVECCDAAEWLQKQTSLGFVFTSMPDVIEMRMSLSEWKEWTVNTAEVILTKLEAGACAIFYQTDSKVINKDGVVEEWIDKSFLCNLAASRVSGVRMLWHKIALLADVETYKYGRPSYTHVMCFTKTCLCPLQSGAIPDVTHRGDMVWAKGMGLRACIFALRWAKSMGAKCITDPFCGKGTALAVANMLGMDAVGVELSPKRYRTALRLLVSDSVLELVVQVQGKTKEGKTAPVRKDKRKAKAPSASATQETKEPPAADEKNAL